MRVVEEVETPYNDIDIWETEYGYDFEVSGGTHATYNRHRLLTGYAWDAITAATMLWAGGTPNKILMLGLGGGTSIRQIRHFLPTSHITAIEIDEEMVSLANRYMALDDLNLNIVIGDGYKYIENSTETFDIVIDDVYLGISSGVIRPLSYTYDLIDKLANRLNDTGSLVTNVITGHGYSKTHRTIKKAYSNYFNKVIAVKPPYGFNTSYVGGKLLGDPEQLNHFLYQLEHPDDIREWEKLVVERISSKKR
jgi:spermidine synthase